MEKSCENCKYQGYPMGSDPCLGCFESKCSENVTYGEYTNFEWMKSCGTCKYRGLLITEEPCDSCNIRFGNDKWEADENE